MMENWNWNDMMGYGFGGGAMMIIFWIFIILAGFAFWRLLIENLKNNANVSKTALDILKEKYVKGEISKEEFETKKKDIL